MADRVSSQIKRKTTQFRGKCLRIIVFYFLNIFLTIMHVITNGYRRVSKTNSTDPSQRVPLSLKKLTYDVIYWHRPIRPTGCNKVSHFGHVVEKRIRDPTQVLVAKSLQCVGSIPGYDTGKENNHNNFSSPRCTNRSLQLEVPIVGFIPKNYHQLKLCTPKGIEKV